MVYIAPELLAHICSFLPEPNYWRNLPFFSVEQQQGLIVVADTSALAYEWLRDRRKNEPVTSFGIHYLDFRVRSRDLIPVGQNLEKGTITFAYDYIQDPFITAKKRVIPQRRPGLIDLINDGANFIVKKRKYFETVSILLWSYAILSWLTRR
jgi:hypothetical protein